MIEAQERRKPNVKVVMFLIYQNGEFLIEERIRPDSSYNGFFMTPAGHVENGDSFEATLVREAGEEHGIIPKEYILLSRFENVSLSGEFAEVQAYLITGYTGEIKNNEPEKCILHWMSYDEAMNRAVLASDQLVLLRAKEVLSGQN